LLETKGDQKREREQRRYGQPTRSQLGSHHWPWIIAQSWENLLFAHWPIAAARLRPFIPAQLALDTFDGQAWLGVIPFRIARLAARGLPPRAGLAFPELNVRTYVSLEGKPGIWFFSLDAASAAAVIGARAAFHLPYFWARMTMRRDDDGIAYGSLRRHPGMPPAGFAGRYRPIGPVFTANPGMLEDWLTARYCLYAANRYGDIFRTEIHHAPWPLQPAEADISVNTMTAPLGIALPDPPLLHFARRLDVVTWPPEWVGGRNSEDRRKRSSDSST
jgi:uncharacterized protein YqjF (DUF2071 family)